MKKAILVIALLLATVLPAAAQSGTAFGIKAGVNFANLSFDPDDEESVESRTGLVVGALVLVPVNPRFAFQPEFLYSQQGATQDEGDGKIKLDYFNIPLLANINLTSGTENSFSLIVGPQLGFRTSAKAEFEGEEEDFKDETESFDFGMVLGVAGTMKNFLIDARYTWGLSNINKIESDAQKVKNRVFTISAGILFR